MLSKNLRTRLPNGPARSAELPREPFRPQQSSRFSPRTDWGVADEKAHIAAVTAALASFGESVRNAIDESDEFGDVATSDLFTEVSRGIDYQLWLV
jgi:DNA-binding ferritin-like protein